MSDKANIFAAFLVLVVGFLVCDGCTRVDRQLKEPSSPVIEHHFPQDTGAVILRPGQSAALMEEVVGWARIPAQGGTLYEGPVRFEKGVVILRPAVEE